MLDTLLESLQSELELFIAFLPRLTLAVLVAFFIYLLGRAAVWGTAKVLVRTSMPSTYHPFFKKLVSGLSWFLAFIAFLNLIGYTNLAASVLAGGGLTAVMLGFAFKDIGENFLAGFFLAVSRPFDMDDIIETEGITGRVKKIELRSTHIRTSDGSDVFIPSVQLFTRPLKNYTLDGLQRGSFIIGIDYRDDVSKARELLLETVTNTKKVLKSPPPSIRIKQFEANFVSLQILFWINAKDPEHGLGKIGSEAMDACRITLLENGYTVSSEVKTGITLDPVDVMIEKT